MIGRLLRRPVAWVLLGLLTVGAGIGFYLFRPDKLFTSTTVNEALSSPVPAAPTSGGTPATSATPAGPVLLAEGNFITHEHDTSGSARIVRLVDGTHRLEIVNLDTSDGPDLRVWLTDQPVKEGTAGWRVFDDGRYIELGKLKGNKGNQVYEIPADVDLSQYRSVSIWCKRFSVSFGAAELAPAS